MSFEIVHQIVQFDNDSKKNELITRVLATSPNPQTAMLLARAAADHNNQGAHFIRECT